MEYIYTYAVAVELRPGSQHSADGAEDFLQRYFYIIRQYNIDLGSVLLMIDSARDASNFITLCI